MSKDYYKILGIAEFETADNIKTAYRKLARQWHPDIAGDSKEAILRFKEINEAYEILSNKVKKEEYDRARRFYNYAKSSTSDYSNKTKAQETSRDKEKKSKNFNFNWEDFITKKQTKSSYKKEENLPPKRGQDVFTEIEITVFEALSGTIKTINMLQSQVCPKCKGKKFANGSICNHCHGKGEISNYKKFSVKIPAEIKDKSKIRLSGEGCLGENGGKNGDLYVTIKIKDPQEFKTEGLNVYKKIVLAPQEAVLGTKIQVTTLNERITVNIAPNTQNGQKIRLSNCGIVQNNKIGDMILTVEIKIPENLSDEELDLYRKLEELASKKK